MLYLLYGDTMKNKVIINSLLFLSFIMLISISFNPSNASTNKSTEYGIRVNSEGSFTLNGTYFKAMGVNGFRFLSDEFILFKGQSGASSGYQVGDYVKRFQMLKDYNIPFARIPFGSWGDISYDVFDMSADHHEYFAISDKLVKAAEEYNIGIIIDFFWLHTRIPTRNGEYFADLANPNSKTIQYQTKFINAIINRYKNSPAIWGYEIGNEYNLNMDYYDAKTNNAKNFITTNELADYYKNISNKIAAVDSTRLITTGDSMVRKEAYSLYTVTKDIYYSNHKPWSAGSKGTNFTTFDDYKSMIKKLNGGAINTLSLHFYEQDSFKPSGIGGTIDIYLELAKKTKQGVYLGEFGGGFTSESDAKTIFDKEMASITKRNIQLSSPWLSSSDGYYMKQNASGRQFYYDALKDYFFGKMKAYNDPYKGVYSNAWSAWKKSISVNSNIGYKITKTSNYTNETKDNTVSSYYLTGDKVSITIPANNDYDVKSIVVKTESGSDVSVSNNQFTMPNDNVTVTINTEKKTSQIKIGDVNNDGKINSMDYVLIRKSIMKQVNLSDTQIKAADLNTDGKVTTQDYVLLKIIIMNSK